MDDKDIEKLTSVFVTKNEFNALKEEVSVIKENTQNILVAVDGLAKSFERLDHEYVSMKTQVNRHEKWHHQTAEKIGINLEA